MTLEPDDIVARDEVLRILGEATGPMDAKDLLDRVREKVSDNTARFAVWRLLDYREINLTPKRKLELR